MDRRLAAILAADVVGFSALVGCDEAGTVRTMKGHLAALEPIVGLNGGRIVTSTGDGFLAEFPSVVAAVTCSATMQRQMTERNAAQPADRRMEFRIGVHVGDVVIDGDDILGDGVNIAARLQTVAAPGGVVISSRVHEDVADKVDLSFEDIGEQRLKNIARPIRAFAIALEQAALAPVVEPSRPSKPSIAVLAFDNLSGDQEQDYFADGVTEDIITGLSRVPWLFVIARNSSFSYKGLAVDIRQVGRELGVRYVLEGSVRRAGQRLRVTGQLIEAESGAHLWADRFDGVVEDVFDLQDRITGAVVGAIAPVVRMTEIERATRKRPENLDAYDHFLRAQAAIAQFRLREADEQLADSLARASDYSEAKALRGWLRTVVWHSDTRLTADSRDFACRMAEEVLQAPGADIEAQAYAGYTLAFLTDEFERGLSHVTQAIELCPNCNSAWGSSCLLNAMRGSTAVALEHGETALRLNPRDPLSYRVHIGMMLACVVAQDWERALECVERARPFRNQVLVFRVNEIAALVHLGRHERAETMAKKLLALNPGFTVGHYRENRRRVRAMRPGGWEPIYEALAAAGVPE